MIKKNIVKIILDVMMSMLLFLLYSKNAVNLRFHEVGGLILFGIFLIHKGLNWKWIVSVSKRLFDKNLPIKTRLGYIIDVMLFICMTFIIVSGIFISKTLFTGLSLGDGRVWKLGHYFAAAVAIILIGVHIGLHWSFIKNMFAKVLKIPRVIAKPLVFVCLVAILLYGGYNSVTTSFSRWITAPFSTVATERHMPQIQLKEGDKQAKRIPQVGQVEGIEGKWGHRELEGGNSIPFIRILSVITTFGSITSIFAALTILIEKLFIRNFSCIKESK